MEKLIVKNFLTLQDIEIDIKKINVIIGRQAEGKSILAKLVYFFRDFFNDYLNSIMNQQDKRQFDKRMKDKFLKIFPRYAWQKQKFEIKYLLNDFSISIINQLSTTDRAGFKLTYSENLSGPRKRLATEWKKIVEQDISQDFNEKMQEFLPSLKEINLSLDGLIFMPAGRSFFAIIQDNIFSFLTSSIDIDYFLSEFGSSYQFFKNVYKNEPVEQFDTKYFSKTRTIVDQILSGQYQQERGRDYIYLETTNQKINISDASSGQQEFLPVAIILILFPFVEKFGTLSSMLFIEEPEAHLFPLSQKRIIDLIAIVFNNAIKQSKKARFFLTTHSPYILTSLNNLIQAGNILKSINKHCDKNIRDKLKKQLFTIFDEDQILDVNDISAYMLQHGKLENIIDQETQLINATLIDEISDEIGCTFDQLLALEIEE